MLRPLVLVLVAASVVGCYSSGSDTDPAVDAKVSDEAVSDAGFKDPSTYREDASTDASEASPLDAGDAAAEDGGDGGPIVCGTGEDIRTGSTCGEHVDGVFAIKTVLDVWWQDGFDPPTIDPGRGHITLYQRATISEVCDDGTIENVEIKICGLTLPAQSAWVACEAYQFAAPDSVWDQPTMPVWVTTGSVGDFGLGGVLKLGTINALIGIELADELGEWPAFVGHVTCGAGANQPEACFRDPDGDGVLGVPFLMANIGENYRPTGCGINLDQPVRFQASKRELLSTAFCEPNCERVTTLHVGFRANHAARAAFGSCTDGTQLSGSSEASVSGLRAIGCDVNNGESCRVNDVELMDSVLLKNYRVLAVGDAPPTSVQANPCECAGGCLGEACVLDQTPSVGTRTAMVRLGDTSSSFDCTDIRSAVEAAYPGAAL